MVCQKKTIAGPGEAGYQSCIKLWPMVEHAIKFSGIIIHYISSSVWRTAQQAQRITHSCCSIYTQKNHHCYGHQTVDVGDLVRNYCMAFFGYHGSKCTEDKDVIQKYLYTDRKWEIHLPGQSHFYAKLSQMQKTYKNQVHLK